MVAWLIGLAVLVSLVIFGGKKIKTEKEIIVEYYNYDLEFLKYINTHRKSLNLKTLKPIKSLDQRAKEAVEKIPPVEEHYNSQEILGGGHQTLSALFNHYLKSEGHKNMIENENFKYIGIAIKIVENKYYNVTIFSE